MAVQLFTDQVFVTRKYYFTIIPIIIIIIIMLMIIIIIVIIIIIIPIKTNNTIKDWVFYRPNDD